MSYDTGQVISSKVKAKQQQVEVTMALNTSSSNYDASKGRSLWRFDEQGKRVYDW